MLKKLISLGLLASLLFSSCTPKDTATSANTASANAKTKETVTLGLWQGNEQEQNALDAVLKNIEEKHNIVVEKKMYTEYETQLKADIAGGVAPDVFYVDAFIAPELVESQVLEPIPDNIKQETKVDDFFSNLMGAFSDGTNLYGLPKDFSALAVFYDETLLTNAGFTKDDIPKALEEWPAFLEKLQQKLPSGVAALSVNQELARLMSLLQTSGSKVYKENGECNLDDANIIKAVQFIGNMFKNKLAKTPKELGNDWVGDSLGTEKAAIVIEGNWMIGHLKNNFPNVKYGTLEMPTYNGKPNTLTFTVAYSIFAKSKNKEAASKLVMYLTDAENMKTWCNGAGVLPSRDSVSKELKLEEDTIQKDILKGVSYSIPWQSGVTLTIINREFNNWFPKVCTGEMTAADAMKEATKTANNDISSLIQ